MNSRGCISLLGLAIPILSLGAAICGKVRTLEIIFGHFCGIRWTWRRGPGSPKIDDSLADLAYLLGRGGPVLSSNLEKRCPRATFWDHFGAGC